MTKASDSKNLSTIISSIKSDILPTRNRVLSNANMELIGLYQYPDLSILPPPVAKMPWSHSMINVVIGSRK